LLSCPYGIAIERNLMEHSQELARQIRTRIGELEADLEAHRRALAVLEETESRSQPSSNGGRRGRTRKRGGDTSQATARTSSSARSAPVGARRRRTAVSSEAVFDALNEGNDQAAVIAKEFGVSTTVVRHRLEQLEQAGRVSRSGERRGTRWRSHAAS
jgi:predicted Rossmann fold nucleotide-binding protein DprA/Smf involved in DNA uptake